MCKLVFMLMFINHFFQEDELESDNKNGGADKSKLYTFLFRGNVTNSPVVVVEMRKLDGIELGIVLSWVYTFKLVYFKR